MYAILGGRLYRNDVKLCSLHYSSLTIHTGYDNTKCSYHINDVGEVTHNFDIFRYKSPSISIADDIKNMMKSGVIDNDLCEYIWKMVCDSRNIYNNIINREFDYVEYDEQESPKGIMLEAIYLRLFYLNLSQLMREMLNESDGINLVYVSIKNQIRDILASPKSNTKSARIN